MVISSREASWFISIAVILLLLLNKSLMDIRPKFRTLAVPLSLDAANICHCDSAAGYESILRNIVLTFTGQKLNCAADEIRLAIYYSLKWNTPFLFAGNYVYR